ncbi:hypothetical protein LC653_18000 [Nostoc sp. CHAB 5784]|uniref:hypothetical protein n=1 Tax=Nostoc mirabile TaxID=2907820 RepID=UPI001E627AC7|nr:hypothetical protein [Nostoc mirabile]MCC5665762.1 hypothetical protein [Nostoc mirabile CHAB5784]
MPKRIAMPTAGYAYANHISSNTVQLAAKTINCVGWGATALGGFPDLKQVALEEQNPTFSRVCWVTLKFHPTYDYP